MNSERPRVFLVLVSTLMLAVAVIAPAASAASATSTPRTIRISGDPWSGMMGGGWCGGGFWNGSGATWGGTGMWGTAFGAQWLGSHPAALDAWLTLRADHMTELRAWFEQYKGDLTSSPAQQALQALWRDHWNDMKAFYEQYANGTVWVCPALELWDGGMMGGGTMMWGAGYGAGWLVRHPGAFSDWQTLRSKQINQVRSWWTKYHAQPLSSAAQNALTAMRSHHKRQDLTFMHKRHVTGNTAWSYRGWMGLGGTWGGWGW